MRLSVRNRISGQRGGEGGGRHFNPVSPTIDLPERLHGFKRHRHVPLFLMCFIRAPYSTLHHFFHNIRSCDTPLENNAIRSIRFISFVIASPSIPHVRHMYNTPFNSRQKANDATQTDGGCELVRNIRFCPRLRKFGLSIYVLPMCVILMIG